MKKFIITLVLYFLAAFLAVFAAEGVFFYKGIYHPPALLRVKAEDVAVPSPYVSVFNEPPEKHAGTVVVDLSHHNNFNPWEVDTLVSRIASTGFSVKLLKDSADFETSLRSADAYILISPQTSLSSDEIALLKELVARKMKLMLMEEQGRSAASFSGAILAPIPAGEVSAAFGFLFERDYLYNLKENDGNYRNVFLTDFKPNEITKGLKKIVFYSAGSLTGSDSGIVFTDDNTFSSKFETRGKLSPIVLTAGSRVLGIYDVTFLTEPYNASYDNNRLLANIADWLTTSERTFSLADFPYFIKKTPSVVYTAEALIPQALTVKNLLNDEFGINPLVGKYEDASQAGDMVILSLFGDAGKLKSILDTGNIRVTSNTTEVSGVGTIAQSAASVIYYKEGDNNRLVILASNSKQLQDTIQLLKTGEFRQWLVRDSLAIYQPSESK